MPGSWKVTLQYSKKDITKRYEISVPVFHCNSAKKTFTEKGNLILSNLQNKNTPDTLQFIWFISYLCDILMQDYVHKLLRNISNDRQER